MYGFTFLFFNHEENSQPILYIPPEKAWFTRCTDYDEIQAMNPLLNVSNLIESF